MLCVSIVCCVLRVRRTALWSLRGTPCNGVAWRWPVITSFDLSYEIFQVHLASALAIVSGKHGLCNARCLHTKHISRVNWRVGEGDEFEQCHTDQVCIELPEQALELFERHEAVSIVVDGKKCLAKRLSLRF